MLKELQKVRDVLEEVTHVYVEESMIGDAFKREKLLVYVSSSAKEIISDINNMIYTDVGYAEYFTVHDKIMHMCANMVSPGEQLVRVWLNDLIDADNEAIKALVFI